MFKQIHSYLEYTSMDFRTKRKEDKCGPANALAPIELKIY